MPKFSLITYLLSSFNILQCGCKVLQTLEPELQFLCFPLGCAALVLRPACLLPCPRPVLLQLQHSAGELLLLAEGQRSRELSAQGVQGLAEVSSALPPLLPRLPQCPLLSVQLLLRPQPLSLQVAKAGGVSVQPADGRRLAQLQSHDVLMELSDEGLLVTLGL